MMRTATPALPDDPSLEQIDAWIELAELVGDSAFRSRVREMAVHGSGDPPADPDAAQRTAAVVSEKAGAALAADIDPAAPEARPVLDEIVAAFAAEDGHADDAAFREELAARPLDDGGVALGYRRAARPGPVMRRTAPGVRT